jgi:hypothetical protein
MGVLRRRDDGTSHALPSVHAQHLRCATVAQTCWQRCVYALVPHGERRYAGGVLQHHPRVACQSYGARSARCLVGGRGACSGDLGATVPVSWTVHSSICLSRTTNHLLTGYRLPAGGTHRSRLCGSTNTIATLLVPILHIKKTTTVKLDDDRGNRQIHSQHAETP